MNRDGLIALILIFDSVLGSFAQDFQPEGRLTFVGREVLVSANDPRPLYQAMTAISDQFGWVIDYEDPVYSASESRDSTDPEWRSTHPGQQGIMLPSGGGFEAKLGHVEKVKSHDAGVVRSLVTQYNQTQNPGLFKVIEVAGARTVLTGESRSATSRYSPVFDSIMQPKREKQNGFLALEDLISECSSRSGIPIRLGLVPTNILNGIIVEGFEGTMTCRADLARILSGLPSAFSYQMLYDISSQGYFLSIVGAHQTVMGSDSESELVPMKESATGQVTRNCDAEVGAILDKILKRGEGSSGDIKTSTWVPPSQKDLQEIRDLGKDAIPSLDRALDTRRPFQQLLAVKLLGVIGGTEVVAPLRRALEPVRVNSVRIAALAALRNAPDDVAIPIIESAVHDADPVVAQRARDLITNYYGLAAPD